MNSKTESATNVIFQDMVFENINDYEESEVSSVITPVPLNKRISSRLNKGKTIDKVTYKTQASYVKEPSSWDEMLKLSLRERRQWTAAAGEEMRSLQDHQVWELAELLPGKKAISCKWVFTVTLDGEDRGYTHKARLVVRCFSQRYGEAYDEIYAPVVRHDTIRVLLAAAAQRNLDVRQLDVKTAYLNGDLDEEIYGATA